MAEYRIQAVAMEVKEYTSKFGDMKNYRVQLSGETDMVNINQKAATPAPLVGDVLNGTIEEGQYGKKFKKEYNPSGGPGLRSGGSKPFDSFSMYLSYAKDIAVALLATKEGFSEEKYAELVGAVAAGGAQLYESRPEASLVPGTAKETPREVGTLAKQVDEVFNTDQMPPHFLEKGEDVDWGSPQ